MVGSGISHPGSSLSSLCAVDTSDFSSLLFESSGHGLDVNPGSTMLLLAELSSDSIRVVFTMLALRRMFSLLDSSIVRDLVLDAMGRSAG